MYCTLCYPFQGPTGVFGPKGARGAQGPSVSNFFRHKKQRFTFVSLQ